MKRVVASLLAVSIAVGGCATAAKDVSTSYVSPLQYQSYDCTQIAAETLRIQSKVTELGGRLDQAASNDKAIAGVGIILFWPVLFALGGTKGTEAEYGRLKGEYEALQKSAIDKKCSGAVVASPSTSTSTPAASMPVSDAPKATN